MKEFENFNFIGKEYQKIFYDNLNILYVSFIDIVNRKNPCKYLFEFNRNNSTGKTLAICGNRLGYTSGYTDEKTFFYENTKILSEEGVERLLIILVGVDFDVIDLIKNSLKSK